MRNPVTSQTPEPLRTRAYEVDIFHCAFDIVENWGEPVLRNNFWRCYLPLTDGASLHSAEQKWSMRKDAGIIIPPDCPVQGYADVPFTLYYAHFNCSIRLMHSTPSTFKIDPTIRAALDQAATQHDEPLFRGAVLQFVSAAIASLPASRIRNQSRDRRTGKAYRIMNEHIDTKLGNAELARQLHMSETSLLRLFRDNVGSSPHKEHLRIRLNHAAALLQHSEKSLEQIADECGFCDSNHFTRVFTREWKIPPGRYRRSTIFP
ncbi:MAG: AraC family transcriptional regulator [Lentisphaeria bacterium]